MWTCGGRCRGGVNTEVQGGGGCGCVGVGSMEIVHAHVKTHSDIVRRTRGVGVEVETYYYI